jgi:hypothetical protein
MKSFLTLVFVVLVLITVVGGGGLLFYLSHTTEFSRKDKRSGITAVPAATTPATRPSPAPAPTR